MGLHNLGLNNNDDEDDDEDYEEDEEERKSKKRKRRKKKDTTNEDYNKKATIKNVTGTFRNSTSVLNVAPKEKEPEWKKTIRKFLDSSPVQIVMTTFTVYILFADDIKMIATKKQLIMDLVLYVVY
jgi:FtsZ-interacting cell division protein YlmF